MPWEEERVASEVFLVTADGKAIYHAYKNGNADRQYHYIYTTRADSEEDEFDVRRLPGYSDDIDDEWPPVQEHHKEVIRAAIASGDIDFPEED
jgi:hypothetical protein